MKKVNPRIELIFLMRGFFATPLITGLAKKGLLDKFISLKKFKPKNFKEIKNQKFLLSILNYFTSLGLLEKKKNFFKVTNLGKKIFIRKGTFFLLSSYRAFINNIDSLLNSRSYKLYCDRVENVIGSGLINGRKFFPAALNLIKDKKYDLVVDIGCGDGEFIRRCSKVLPKSKYLAIDLSSDALDQTKMKMKKYKKKIDINYFKCEASNINKWSKIIKKISSDSTNKILISMWYLIHEISQNNKQKIINFINKINNNLKNVDIVIGEILELKHEHLFLNRSLSIMPEFLFFHEISGQGVLSLDEYNFIERKINFKTIKKIYFDKLKSKNKVHPSAMVWYLSSNKN